MSATDLAAAGPSHVRASELLRAAGAAALTCLVMVLLLPSSTARAAGSEWTAQQMFGTPYSGTTFNERFRYVNPQILAFSDGTAEAIWTDVDPPVQGIRGRHLGVDSQPMDDAYDIGYPASAFIVPRSKVAPLTGSLGIMVMDATISDTERKIYGRLLGPNGPVGAIFEISAAIGRIATNDFDVASNGDGTATVAWPEYDGTALAIKERQINVTGVSGAVVTASDPLARPENTNAVNTVEVRGHGDGTATIAWSEQPNPYITNLSVRRVGASGVLGSIRQIVSGSASAIHPPRIAAHSDGSVTAVWGTVNSVQSALHAAQITASGHVLAADPVLDTSSGGWGKVHFYDVGASGNGSAIVVARRPLRDVVSWRIDSNGQAGPFSTLETPEDLFPRLDPSVVSDGQGAVVAAWAGLMPSSSLTALHAARMGSDNTVLGNQTLFPLADATDPAQILSTPALSGDTIGALPIWSAWTDWTANPAADPTTTRQVYAARHPRMVTPTVRPTRMVAFGDSYSSGQGLLEEPSLRYDCGTDMKRARYRTDTTVLAKHFWTSTDCDTRTLSSVQPSDLYHRDRGTAIHENRCYRHGRAYPNQLRSTFGIASEDFLFLACGGATTTNIGLLKKTAAQYPHSPANVHGGETQVTTADPFAESGEPDLVTIGVGGNDAGFVDIINRCVDDNCLDPVFQTGAMSQINGTAFNRLAETFRKLASRYPAASVLAFGYPEIVGDPDKPCGFLGAAHRTISDDELDWIKTVVQPALNSAVSRAAAEAGVAYIDIEAATRGHELCSDTDDRWINGITLGDDLYVKSLHPNQSAHDAISRYFIDHYTDGYGGLLLTSPAFRPLNGR